MDSFFHLDTPHVEPCSRACPPNAKRTIHQSAISDSQHSAKRVHVKHSTHHAPSQGLLPEAEWAVMQLQPPGLNLCWTPVVAFVASHYSRSAVTLDNVLCKVYGVGPARDDAESAVQVVENVYGIASEDYSWIAPEFLGEWSYEARVQGWSSQEIDAFDQRFMFLNEDGVEEVNDAWFRALQACIARGDLALLLLQRLEASECRANGGLPPTHYLVVVGWHRAKGRRGALGLFVKDPMDGNQTSLAVLQSKVEDHCRQRIVLFNTISKDWYRPMECTILTAAE